MNAALFVFDEKKKRAAVSAETGSPPYVTGPMRVQSLGILTIRIREICRTSSGGSYPLPPPISCTRHGCASTNRSRASVVARKGQPRMVAMTEPPGLSRLTIDFPRATPEPETFRQPK